MNADLRELYQEIIIDHNKNPRNFREMVDATVKADGFNPLCGDKLTVYLHVEDGIVKDISFIGNGCAISKASASLMTESLQGKTVEDAHDFFHRIHRQLTEDDDTTSLPGKLAVLAGVKAFPARVKCATLAWHTLDAALNRQQQPVSTE